MRVLLLLLPSLGGGVGVGVGVGLPNEVDLRNGLVLPYNMRTRVAPQYNLTFPCPTFSYPAASPNSVHKLRYLQNSSPCSASCTLHSVNCTAHYKLHTAHCTLHTVNFKVNTTGPRTLVSLPP